MATLRVLRPGMLTTIQDAGRVGFAHLGFRRQGALDTYALRWALKLAGCGQDGAAIEVTLLGPTLELESGEAWLALAGADLGARLDGETWPPGETRRLRAGQRVTFGPPVEGLRAYLACTGGIAAAKVLGSRSTDLQGGFGGFAGRALAAGDALELGEATGELWRAPVPTAVLDGDVRVLAGPREDLCGPAALERLTAAPYRVRPDSDRVGLRLQGTPVPGAPGDLLSEGLPVGGVEVPPSGQPIVLLAGRGSVGGYPVPATVITPDLPLLGQVRPGEEIRFVQVTMVEARAARAVLERRLALAPTPLA